MKGTFTTITVAHQNLLRNGSKTAENQMTPLALVKNQIEKALRLKDAQKASLIYRGVPYEKTVHWHKSVSAS
jgi:hypothetical protein